MGGTRNSGSATGPGRTNTPREEARPTENVSPEAVSDVATTMQRFGEVTREGTSIRIRNRVNFGSYALEFGHIGQALQTWLTNPDQPPNDGNTRTGRIYRGTTPDGIPVQVVRQQGGDWLVTLG